VLQIRSVERTTEDAISEEDARRAGEPSKAALLKRLRPTGELHRVVFELGGEDPRVALRQRDDLTDEDIQAIEARLARMDANHAWTRQTLTLIASNPGTRAADLAPRLGQERLAFKANVRKLKELGLTISLERGYELSPRGAAYLKRTTSAPRQ
jgi:hypothetical protein